MGIFGEKPVPGMDGFNVGNLCGGDDGGDVQVTLRTLCATDTDGFVRKPHVKGVLIDLGVYGNRPDAQFTAGAHDAQGDFPPVGDKDF